MANHTRMGGGAICHFIMEATLIVCADIMFQFHNINNSGSFLVMVMKMVSLGFDVDSRTDRHGEKRPPSVPRVPNFAEYTSYCMFPSTTIFGPFITFNEHKKFLSPSPLVCMGIP